MCAFSFLNTGWTRQLVMGGVGAGLLVLSLGCSSTPDLHSARANVYKGRLDRAETALKDLPPEHRDRVLYLMERGMIRQLDGDYRESTEDWLDAARLIEDLGYLSVSRSSASMLANDATLNFVGHPYERTLLRGFLAKSYLSQSLWDDVAVESRNIIKSLENLNGYPDIAYARYMAGFGLELFGDHDGAALEYRKADKLTPELAIDPKTGSIQLSAHTNSPTSTQGTPSAHTDQLIVFYSSGNAPSSGQGWVTDKPNSTEAYAEIVVDGKVLGRTYILTDLNRLLNRTEIREAKKVMLKDLARIAVKETIAQAVEAQDELIGELVRLILFSLERPDARYWGTLPRTLSVARVACPKDLTEFELVRKTAQGTVISRHRISSPITHKQRLHIAPLRDLTLPAAEKSLEIRESIKDPERNETDRD